MMEILFLSMLLLLSSFTSVQGFGLITNKGEPLGLLKFSTKAFIKGSYTEIRYLCTYKYTFNEPVKAQFFLPQAEDTILSKFEVQLQNKTISAQVVEKEQAKQVYLLNAKESTILQDFQLSKVDKNVLDIKIGDIAANEVIQIEFSFIQPLEIIINKFFGLRIPAILEHREWEIEVELVSDSPLSFTANPSHHIKPHITAEHAKLYKAFWSAKIASTKDFVIYFRPEKMQEPTVFLAAHPVYKEDYVLFIDFVPQLNKVDLEKAQKELSFGDEELLKNWALEEYIQNVKGEFLFFVDRIGSSQLENIKKALIKFLYILPKNAFFNIIYVGSTNYLYKPQSVKNSPEALEDAIKWVETMESGLEENDLLGALQSIFINLKYNKNDELRAAFVMTDSLSVEAIHFVRSFSDMVRFCAIGIGEETSESLEYWAQEVGDCQGKFEADGKDLGDKALYMVKGAISSYIRDVYLKIACFDEEKRLLYDRSDRFERLLKDQPLRHWEILDRTQNIKSCHVNVSYNNSLSSEREIKEFNNRISELAEGTDIWHKLAFANEKRDAKEFQETIDLSIKYQYLSENTSLLAKTRENNFDTEISMQNIYLTNLTPADYSFFELTIFYRLFLQYRQFLIDAFQSLVWLLGAWYIEQVVSLSFYIIAGLIVIPVAPLKVLCCVYIAFLIVLVFRFKQAKKVKIETKNQTKDRSAKSLKGVKNQ